MGTVTATATGPIGAPAETTYRVLRDPELHRRVLPPEFSDFTVVEGDGGAGTVYTFTVTAGGRTRNYRMRVSEPNPGRTLDETDEGSSLVTTFEVTPSGDVSSVRITTTWDGAGGIGGFFERLFAPRALAGIYAEELRRIDEVARDVDA
jgi:uncharacterized protein YndB with AHSA1/START domain